MTHTLDAHQRQRLAEHAVRHVAAGTGFTTIVTIGVSVDGVPVLTQNPFSARSLDASYGHLLDTAARVEREHPREAPAYACALVLPERDVAYLHYTDDDGAAHVLAVGRNPVNDPDTHAEVTAGLAAFLQAIQDTQPSHLPTGRAFLAQPGSELLTVPEPAPTDRPRGYQGRHHR